MKATEELHELAHIDKQSAALRAVTATDEPR
jgi:hypothetical protein